MPITLDFNFLIRFYAAILSLKVEKNKLSLTFFLDKYLDDLELKPDINKSINNEEAINSLKEESNVKTESVLTENKNNCHENEISESVDEKESFLDNIEDNSDNISIADIIDVKNEKVKLKGTKKKATRKKFKKGGFPCNECNENFPTKRQIKEHYSLIHPDYNPEKTYCCDLCGKVFKRKHLLGIHKRMHLGDKPFKCETCEKSFADAYLLKVHKRIHDTNKRFQCDICGKGFTRNNEMENHRRIHTGENPFPCDLCDKSFRTNSHLTSHKDVHVDKSLWMTCDECGGSFPSLKRLRMHQKIHSGKKPHECEICGKSFLNKPYLTDHKRRHTG